MLRHFKTDFSETHQFSAFEKEHPEEYPFSQKSLQILIPSSCSFPKKLDLSSNGIETIVSVL